MKALQMKKFGVPAEVVEVVDIAEPTGPSAGEVIARMEYAPINNSELLKMMGRYPVDHGSFPLGLGNEGAARVTAVGANVSHLKVGDLISTPLSQAIWQEKVVAPAKGLFALPEAADLQQLSMLEINPPTAAMVLSEFEQLAAGDWVLQNAANSGVGHCVTAIAKHRGLKVVAIVRRPELVSGVSASGADVVLVDGPELAARVAAATSNARIKLALDGVGGDATVALSGAVAPGGSVVQYSFASGKFGSASAIDLIFRNVAIRGYWLLSPFYATSPKVLEGRKLGAQLVAEGKLKQPVAAVYPLSQAKEALAHAQAKTGKVLFKP